LFACLDAAALPALRLDFAPLILQRPDAVPRFHEFSEVMEFGV
jgi:hypothetical protein